MPWRSTNEKYLAMQHLSKTLSRVSADAVIIDAKMRAVKKPSDVRRGAALDLLGSTKFKFHNLRGFLRRWWELPLLQSVLASLHKQRMPANDARGFDMSIRLRTPCHSLLWPLCSLACLPMRLRLDRLGRWLVVETGTKRP